MFTGIKIDTESEQLFINHLTIFWSQQNCGSASAKVIFVGEQIVK
jgi:hypothetical protein